MPRLAIDGIFILWSLHRSPRCCETDCTTFLSLGMQDNERGQLWWAWRCALNSFYTCKYLYVWCRQKFVIRVWPNHANTSIDAIDMQLDSWVEMWGQVPNGIYPLNVMHHLTGTLKKTNKTTIKSCSCFVAKSLIILFIICGYNLPVNK